MKRGPPPVIVIETSSEQVNSQCKKKTKKNQIQNAVDNEQRYEQHKSKSKNKQRQRKHDKDKSKDKGNNDKEKDKQSLSKKQNLYKIQKVQPQDQQQEKQEKFQKQVKESQQKTEESLIIKFQKTKQIPLEKKSRNRITPWLTRNTKQVQDSLLRLHNQIIEFYNYIKPSNKQHEYKLSIFQLVKYMINQKFPEAQVIPFGSFVTRLYLPDGDIDVAIKIQQSQERIRYIYDQIHRIIKKNQGTIFTEIQYIRKAKVPLIKFVHIQSQIQFDISVNKLDGVQQIKFVNKMDEIYPEFKYLVFVFKCMLRVRGMQQTYTGGIGSFLLFCMILHYLRSTHKKQKYLTLSQHVLRFMQFYGINTDWQRKSIYIQTGDQTPRARQPGTLSFYSPQDDSHDIGKSAYKIRDVFNVFKNRYRVIMGTNYKPRQSILKDLVNPNNQQFKYYKYQKKFKSDFQK